MNKAVCFLSVIPVRKEPAHRSEMTSQLIFGEFVDVESIEGDFVKVTCQHDGYGGWVQQTQLKAVEQFYTPIGYTADWMHQINVFGVVRNIPFGAPMYEQDVLQALFEVTESFTGPLMGERKYDDAAVASIYQQFLGAPYLWGGRSVFGIDCSGFAQQVMKYFGVRLQRDAYLQADEGKVVDQLSKAQSGDLAFFNNEAGRITHVGLLLGNDKIVHASGSVRIDDINEDGIWNVDTGAKTHQLHSVRTYLKHI